MFKKSATALFSLLPVFSMAADLTAEDIEKIINKITVQEGPASFRCFPSSGAASIIPAQLEKSPFMIEHSEAIQKFLEEGTVLRKKDLKKYLEQRGEILNHADIYEFIYQPFSRMRIQQEFELRINCPSCKKRFSARNCYGLLLSIVKQIDLVPDFSSICPYCSGETQKNAVKENVPAGTPQPKDAVKENVSAGTPLKVPQQEALEGDKPLRVTVRFAGKEVESKLFHADLHLLYYVFAQREVEKLLKKRREK